MPKETKNEEKKSNAPAALLAGTVALGIGQQTIRSGIPRVLGVRLESHSTSNKNAAEILRNGGYLDPERSGTAATRGLEVGQGLPNVTDINKAKNKVYITGVRPDSISRVRVSPFNSNRSIKIDPKNQNIITQLFERKARRNSYRSQSYLDWDKINSSGNYAEVQSVKNRERAKQMLYGQLMPWRGRSLYIGGSDDFFMKNFKPDFDDPGAQYSEQKVKVYGNRFAAAKAAIDREGLGNLMKANKGRVAAGAAILAGGGLATAALAKAAVDLVRSDGTVKGYKRKTKTGKIAMVRSFKRDLK